MGEKMIQPSDLPPPDTIIDYGDGQFGPLMLHYAIEGQDIRQIMSDAGFDSVFLSMEHDLGGDDDHPLIKSYFDDGASDVCVHWQPKTVEGWKLVGKHDTEDGPIAIFVRQNAAPSPKGQKP